jgi:hypothetical protein
VTYPPDLRTISCRGNHDRVEFLTDGIAEIAGLRTTWFRDPWRNVFILMEKDEPTRPYYRQR